jgi:hypothetical protein
MRVHDAICTGGKEVPRQGETEKRVMGGEIEWILIGGENSNRVDLICKSKWGDGPEAERRQPNEKCQKKKHLGKLESLHGDNDTPHVSDWATVQSSKVPLTLSGQ